MPTLTHPTFGTSLPMIVLSASEIHYGLERSMLLN
jgi:hypothetical protein